MPWVGDQWFAWEPIRTRQFVFSHHSPISGLPFTVIPDVAMTRICATFVREVNDLGCWRYKGHRREPRRPWITFTSGGVQHGISGGRLALMLLTDAPIPVGVTANHEHFCPNGSWCVCPTHVYAGTPTTNMLDAYFDGRRSVPAHPFPGVNDYPRLLREREARAGQPIRCTRFFAEEIQEEIRRGSAMQDMRPSRAA
ncbi:hypothetical protein QO012_004559 [Methylobacterium aerolatum]|uniref:Uncharacterized protein n=1 Tax=Methylobacterium aerolatum TaxID=418708 RepID=A0ABU0I5Z2_9HYPH|nr:hypothetical protein [Methylobacterium aerolatum]